MELHIFLKTQTEPVIYKGDRIDVLDFEMNGPSTSKSDISGKASAKASLLKKAE